MATFKNVTLDQFKTEAKKLLDALPECTEDEAENGLKCLGLLYLGDKAEGWLEYCDYEAELLLNMANEKWLLIQVDRSVGHVSEWCAICQMDGEPTVPAVGKYTALDHINYSVCTQHESDVVAAGLDWEDL